MVRRILVVAGIGATAIVSAVIALPILPAHDARPAVAMNSDVGETIGWPELVRQVTSVYRRAPKPAVIFTSNYGEAGALDRFGGRYGLPPAYSGHNGFGEWGPPAGGQRSVVIVGLRSTTVWTYFRGCRPATQITNSAGIDNEERGKLVVLCAAPRASWSTVWARLRHLS
jgi:hypothetical protein